MSSVSALGLWEIAKPHLEALVRRTGESSSMAIGTRFPAAQTSQGKVLLAGQAPCGRR